MNDSTPGWRRFLPALVVLTVLAAAFTAMVYGRGSFFLVLAGGVLLLVIWTFWESLQTLTGDAPLTLDEALSLTAPSAEEERKVAVLRALKDLEYERSVGKISDDDYQHLSRKYRAEAKQLLQLLDEQLEPARERARKLLDEHLARSAEARQPDAPTAGSGAEPEADPRPATIAEASATTPAAEASVDPEAPADPELSTADVSSSRSSG